MMNADDMVVSEDVPSTDEGVFASHDPAASEHRPSVSVTSLPANILVATSEGLFTADQLQEAGIKTTHIVIHDQASAIASDIQLKDRATKPFKYNWDPSVHQPVLPVRCRNVSGELHKDRFGSGSRGRCIKVGDEWYTPSEFEAICGRASSKDWKRSIRYAGRTLQCLIEENILQPHATSCTCTACCDDTAVSGPIRLFTPYKRKKRRESAPTTSIQQPDSPKSCSSEASSGTITTTKEAMVVTLPTGAPSGTETLQVVTAPGSLMNGSLAESVVVTPVATPQTPRSAPTAIDFNEQRHWWQLEEMVKNLVRQVQEIQKQVELVKAQSSAAKEAALQQLRIQMENEKKEALNACRIEAQMNLSRAILEARTEKEIAVQHAIQQTRAEIEESSSNVNITTEKDVSAKRCANCNREAYSECTGCHRVSYCSTFCQRKDWQNHQDECGQTSITDQESVVTVMES